MSTLRTVAWSLVGLACVAAALAFFSVLVDVIGPGPTLATAVATALAVLISVTTVGIETDHHTVDR